MLDITNKNCGPWLQQQLKDLVEKYQFDAFYLDMGWYTQEPNFQILNNILHENNVSEFFSLLFKLRICL